MFMRTRAEINKKHNLNRIQPKIATPQPNIVIAITTNINQFGILSNQLGKTAVKILKSTIMPPINHENVIIIIANVVIIIVKLSNVPCFYFIFYFFFWFAKKI